jgi:hypothetical protein
MDPDEVMPQLPAIGDEVRPMALPPIGGEIGAVESETQIPRDARGRPLVSSNTAEVEGSDLGQLLGPYAHPQTLTDFARILTLPVDQVRRALAATMTTAAARQTTTAVGDLIKRVPRPTGAQVVKAVKFVRHPVRESVKLAADEFLKRMDTAAKTVPAAAEAEVAAAPAAVEAVAPAVARPGPVLVPRATPSAAASALPDQKALNEAAIAARRAAYRASQGAPPIAEKAVVDEVVKASGKMKLNRDEYIEFARLVKRGMKQSDALETVTNLRTLAKGLPTAAEAKATIAARGYKG